MFARGGAPIRKRAQLNSSIKDATSLALSGSNVHCDFSLDEQLWPAEVDEGQFRQVINNIVLNAVLAMPEGGKIEVRSENVEFAAGSLPPLGAGRFIKISIRDFGVGIRPEHLPRIFDPYFTTRKHARGFGSGQRVFGRPKTLTDRSAWTLRWGRAAPFKFICQRP